MYKHKVIVANQVIQDPVFANKAVFLLGHTEKGAGGLILNAQEVGKVGFGHMKDLFNAAPGSFNEAKDMILNGKVQSVPMYSGGPVSTPGIYFLHGHPEFLNMNAPEEEKPEFDLGIPSSFDIGEQSYKDDFGVPPELTVMDGVYFGSPFTFGSIMEAGKLDENKFKFFTGMSTWGPGQLEYEIDNGAWTVIDLEEVAPIFFDSEALDLMVKNLISKKVAVDWLAASSKPSIRWPKAPPGFNPSTN